jgi:tetratricopeptide (TPR) repeat protein
MATLSAANELLASDASSIRNILASEETARSKPHTVEERQKRLAPLQATVASIGQSTDPLRQEARRLIDAGNVTGGEAKLDEALGADEKALAEAERVGLEKRKAAAQSARDLAVLAQGRDVLKAAAYYKRATALDPGNAGTWDDYASAALDAGRLAEAKTAFEQSARTAQAAGDARQHRRALLGQGDAAIAEGSLPAALDAYRAGLAIAEKLAKSDLGNAGWQRDLVVSQARIGDVLVAQGNLPAALDVYRTDLAIVETLARSAPGSADW